MVIPTSLTIMETSAIPPAYKPFIKRALTFRRLLQRPSSVSRPGHVETIRPRQYEGEGPCPITLQHLATKPVGATSLLVAITLLGRRPKGSVGASPASPAPDVPEVRKVQLPKRPRAPRVLRRRLPTTKASSVARPTAFLHLVHEAPAALRGHAQTRKAATREPNARRVHAPARLGGARERQPTKA